MRSEQVNSGTAMVTTGPCPARFMGAYVRILEALCGPAQFRTAVCRILDELARASGCEAAAVRVRDGRGDYPYLVHQGFDDDFTRRETSLCHRGPQGRPEWDEQGRMVLECLCGAVLHGDAAVSPHHFTPAGSFYTNSASELVAGGGVAGDAVRGTCVARGFESLALVPLRDGEEIVGLLQLNHRGKGRFDEELLAFLEEVGRRLGAAVRVAQRLDELATARGEMEEQRRGREQMVMLEEMTSSLAHDIKNPLASMSLSAARLRKALKGDQKLEPLVEHLCAAMQTLSDTVTRVTGEMIGPRPDRGPVDMNRLVEDAVQVILPRAEAQDVRVLFELAEDLPPARGDRILLKRAVLNLLANALDAMPSGGRLRLESRHVGGRLAEVTVADSGAGVAPSQMEVLFKPFHSTKPGGTGMGLCIVRRIAELHAGSVLLRGGARGGTEAVLSIPADKDREARSGAQ